MAGVATAGLVADPSGIPPSATTADRVPSPIPGLLAATALLDEPASSLMDHPASQHTPGENLLILPLLSFTRYTMGPITCCNCMELPCWHCCSQSGSFTINPLLALL